MTKKPKIALISDERVWGCGGGKYFDHVLRILGDDAVGLRLQKSKKTTCNGPIKNIHTSLLENELKDIEQLWFGSTRNEFWPQIEDVILKHPGKKLVIHNMENVAQKYMRCNLIYESPVKWDFQLVHREAMGKIFQDAFPSLKNVEYITSHIALTPEELPVYDTITYEDKQPLVVAASRWSSYKRSTQTFLSLYAAHNQGVQSEMWGVKEIGLDMSQFHMLNSDPEFKILWDEFVAKGCVKGKYEQSEKDSFLRKALLAIDFTTISGKKRIYAEEAHPQYVTLEAVQYRAIPVVCKDAFDDKLDSGYYRIEVPVNGDKKLLLGSFETGKEMAKIIKNMSKNEWEHKTGHNFDVMNRENSWNKFCDVIFECKSRLEK